MPLIRFKCTSCGQEESKLIKAVDLKGLPNRHSCEHCGSEDGMLRQLGGPASVGKMTIDNGVMAKAVEIVPDIVEINKNESNKDRTKGD